MSVKSSKIPPFMTEPLELESQEEMKRFSDAYGEACSLYAQEDWPAALQAYLRMDEEYPYVPCILGFVGVLYRDFGRLEESIGYLKRTVDLSPDSELASIALYHTLRKASFHFQDRKYGDLALEEAERFIMSTGKPSVSYGYILRDMNGELSDEDFQAHMENINNGTAHLEKPFVSRRLPLERWEWDKKFEE